MSVKASKVMACLVPLLLGACSSLGIGESEFSCSGMPQGVACKSAREVYDLTNSRDVVSGAMLSQEARRKTEAAAESELVQTMRKAAATDPAALGGAPVGYGAMPVAYTDDGRVPIRTPAVVMRVWVAPYQDTKGDLHMPGLVFSEVEPRKWQVGLPDAASGSPSAFRPLEATAPKAKPPANDSAPARPAKVADKAEQISSPIPVKQGK
ncbi:conjugal transfer pilus assembly protein TraV [Azospirillum sp. OGB3]|uniref:type IV conjugative transfer system lipoprotein TraV n=1 Tax=Azospirillum sp. OGB3 TaxID=2587012 RepID=UPI0016067648|nr:type IV conjugative transfer system lipoprotein TraV [Azospirillum sp. OGB3]MBB3268622.1 conjugal transfer pilus assembly protein TraV [Azospirillum sp. OGB3]